MEARGRFYRLLVFTKPDGTVFTFDEDGRAKKETYQGGLVRDFTYTSNQTVISGSNGITVTYNLNSFGEVAEYKLQNGENNKDYSYTYDSDGNITTISLNGSLQQTFTYNSSNELVRVDDAVVNKTITYEYDYVGNITSVKTYIYTVGELGAPLTTENYTYNSLNQRTDLSYDANGNMTSLNGFDFTWDGRRLFSAISADTNISYIYNHNGIRTSKTVNGTTIIYTVDVNNNVIEQTDGTNTIKFVYDSSSSPIYMEYNGVIYYYEENLQGDIVAILDANGNTVVEYSYDIWGKLLGITGELADTLGVSNPLRYRGYYYDTEIGLYYLQSRYYSPDLMRYISQDDPVLSNAQGEPLGSNLYAYCNNNPVNFSDPTGFVVSPANVIGAVIGGIIGAVGGYFLSRFLADKLGLKGWKRTVFIAGVSAVVTAAAAVIGYFIGPYIAKLGKAAINSLKKSLIKSACFVAGTKVLTSEGQTSIENISVGDLVWSENPQTGEKGLKPVKKVFINEAYNLFTVTTEKEKIVTTEEHPFWVVNKGWTKAQNLSVGDVLITQGGNFEYITSVSNEYLLEPILVYNFEVQDWHTYYVSDSNILVHNACSLNFARKSASQIEKMLGVKSGVFHRQIKPDILKSVGKNILNRVGKNPDILIAQDGTIKLVSTINKGVSIVTSLNIFDFIP